MLVEIKSMLLLQKKEDLEVPISTKKKKNTYSKTTTSTSHSETVND